MAIIYLANISSVNCISSNFTIINRPLIKKKKNPPCKWDSAHITNYHLTLQLLNEINDLECTDLCSRKYISACFCCCFVNVSVSLVSREMWTTEYAQANCTTKKEFLLNASGHVVNPKGQHSWPGCWPPGFRMLPSLCEVHGHRQDSLKQSSPRLQE